MINNANGKALSAFRRRSSVSRWVTSLEDLQESEEHEDDEEEEDHEEEMEEEGQTEEEEDNVIKPKTEQIGRAHV